MAAVFMEIDAPVALPIQSSNYMDMLLESIEENDEIGFESALEIVCMENPALLSHGERSLLIECCRADFPAGVGLLLDASSRYNPIDLNKFDRVEKQSALIVACRMMRSGCVRLLLKRGIPMGLCLTLADSSGKTAMDYVRSLPDCDGSRTIRRYFSEFGIDIGTAPEASQMTASRFVEEALRAIQLGVSFEPLLSGKCGSGEYAVPLDWILYTDASDGTTLFMKCVMQNRPVHLSELIAAVRRRVAMVDETLADQVVDKCLSKADRAGQTCMHYACMYAHREQVYLELLRNGCPFDWTVRCAGDMSPIFHLLKRDTRKALVEDLYRSICRVYGIDSTRGLWTTPCGTNGVTPVHYAACVGDLAFLSWMVTLDPSRASELLNVIDDLGATPLFYALSNAESACANWLIERGADWKRTDLSGKDCYALCKLILQRTRFDGSSPSSHQDAQNRSLSHSASWFLGKCHKMSRNICGETSDYRSVWFPSFIREDPLVVLEDQMGMCRERAAELAMSSSSAARSRIAPFLLAVWLEFTRKRECCSSPDRSDARYRRQMIPCDLIAHYERYLPEVLVRSLLLFEAARRLVPSDFDDESVAIALLVWCFAQYHATDALELQDAEDTVLTQLVSTSVARKLVSVSMYSVKNALLCLLGGPDVKRQSGSLISPALSVLCPTVLECLSVFGSKDYAHLAARRPHLSKSDLGYLFFLIHANALLLVLFLLIGPSTDESLLASPFLLANVCHSVAVQTVLKADMQNIPSLASSGIVFDDFVDTDRGTFDEALYENCVDSSTTVLSESTLTFLTNLCTMFTSVIIGRV